MKKIGLIGGIGPESTISYYHGIVYGVQRRVGNSFFPNLTIESLNVFQVLELCEDKNYDGLVDYVMHGIRNLAAAGAEFVAMTGNTPHIVFDRLQECSPVPLISIVETACEEAIKQDYTTVGLFGTGATMNGTFFTKPFLESGIEVVKPQDREKVYIANKISTELELGVVRQETIDGFMEIIQRMIVEDKIQAIILGCTELPMLFRNTQLPIACLDTMQIHIDKLVEQILND
jgi:aspartate racemase